jgi:hypothetical protein
MATAKRAEMQHRQPVRWGRNLTILALLVASALTAWFWTRMRVAAEVRASYAAQTGCLCRYSAGRSLVSCQGDASVKQSWVGLHEDAPAHTLTASVPLLATQTARWSTQGGCVLDAWKD